MRGVQRSRMCMGGLAARRSCLSGLRLGGGGRQAGATVLLCLVWRCELALRLNTDLSLRRQARTRRSVVTAVWMPMFTNGSAANIRHLASAARTIMKYSQHNLMMYGLRKTPSQSQTSDCAADPLLTTVNRFENTPRCPVRAAPVESL